MKVPYSIKGAIFAPTLVVLLFVLKVTCPAPTGSGCFADLFMPAAFFPLHGISEVFKSGGFVHAHEPFVILVYWMLIGFLVGCACDLRKKKKELKTGKE